MPMLELELHGYQVPCLCPMLPLPFTLNDSREVMNSRSGISLLRFSTFPALTNHLFIDITHSL
jgi:hypothetical protein